MVAHEHAAELQARVLHLSRGVRPLPDGAVGVFEVARDRSGPEVAPASDDAVAEEAAVRLVSPALEVDVGDLAANLAVRADDRGATDVGSGAHHSPFVDHKRPFEMAAGFDPSARTDDDSPAGRIQGGGPAHGIFGDEDLIRGSIELRRGVYPGRVQCPV